ncbi:MAG: sulfatase-like hydrolase/transferase, partial [Gammaproteobacteria bacterium]|nr:sulfatase-like hydrolase/transferase [Gammaproteobacteria bacterium]
MKATRESDPGLRKSAGQRKPVWPALLPALFALVFGGISPAAQESAASATVPPNIVFMIADDLSWAHLGAYGSDEVRTPNLDRLAREGVVFENAFV